MNSNPIKTLYRNHAETLRQARELILQVQQVTDGEDPVWSDKINAMMNAIDYLAWYAEKPEFLPRQTAFSSFRRQ